MVKSLAFLATVANADTVNLGFTDCGAAATHATIKSLQPSTIELPGKATVTGSGDLDADQTSASFTLKVKKGIIPLISGKGSICEDTTINLPLGAGSFTVKGIDCPAKAGTVEVNVELDILSEVLTPTENDLVDIHIEANADDTGDQVICLDIAATQGVEVEAEGGTLALTWEDCGDASTHGHTDDIQPTEIQIGGDTQIVGTGSTDKQIDSGSFAMKLTAGAGIIKQTFTGEICEAKDFNIPLGLGTVSWGGMDCPVAVGPSTVKMSVKMASALPASMAKADLALTAVDQDGEQALCVNTHLAKQSASIMV